MSLIHLARQGFITKSALPNVTRQRGTTTGTANLMLYGAGKTHSIGTNTTFTDSSTNNFTVTRNGDTIQATNNPFTGSVYFDGTDDYLSVANNTALQPGTGTFTIECWIYRGVAGAAHTIYAKGGTSTGFVFQITSSNTLRFTDTTTNIDSTGTIPALTWTHVAVARSGTGSNQTKLFINGVVDGQGTVATDFNQTEEVRIGTDRSGAADFNGYISCLRFVKGTAVYTANFTVPTSPLTAITNTQLLLLTAQQAPFRDSSTNNFTVTANGNAAGSGLEPFPVNYAGSGYFDGNGDYLTVPNNTALNPGTGDFTLEVWVYFNTLTQGNIFDGNTNGMSLALNGSNQISFGQSNVAYLVTDTVAMTTGSWFHIVAVRSGTTLSLFKNGSRVATATNSSNFTTGTINRIGWNGFSAYFNGSLSNLRIVKGTAVYDPTLTTLTVPTAPLTAVTNTSLLLLTNNVGPFVDTSANGFPVLRNGDAVQTGFSPFTGQPSAGSGYFDGTGDYLTVPNFSALQLTNSTAFTIECWVYPTNLTSGRYVIENYNQSSPFQGYALGYNASSPSSNILEWWEGGASWVNTGITLTLNEWTHIAVTYEGSGTTRRFFKNGVLSGSAGTVPSGINYTAGACSIGAQEAGNSPWFGYISNLRILKGTALYTSNFTPATAPLPAVPNTSLLLNTDNYTIANSTPTYLPVTVAGNTTISTAQYPTGMNRSIYFDGSGDYLEIANNTGFDFGSGEFTIETYVNFSVAPSGFVEYRLWAPTNSASGFKRIAWYVYNNIIQVVYFGTVIASSSSLSWTVGTWYHLAVTRSGNTYTLWRDGVSVGTGTNTNALDSAAGYRIGENINGYFSNFRLTKGSTLYTASFTPPAAPLSLSVTVPNFVTNNIYGVYQLA